MLEIAILPERRHPEYPQEPIPIDEPYLPEDPGDEPGDESAYTASACWN